MAPSPATALLARSCGERLLTRRGAGGQSVLERLEQIDDAALRAELCDELDAWMLRTRADGARAGPDAASLAATLEARSLALVKLLRRVANSTTSDSNDLAAGKAPTTSAEAQVATWTSELFGELACGDACDYSLGNGRRKPSVGPAADGEPASFFYSLCGEDAPVEWRVRLARKCFALCSWHSEGTECVPLLARDTSVIRLAITCFLGDKSGHDFLSRSPKSSDWLDLLACNLVRALPSTQNEGIGATHETVRDRSLLDGHGAQIDQILTGAGSAGALTLLSGLVGLGGVLDDLVPEELSADTLATYIDAITAVEALREKATLGVTTAGFESEAAAQALADQVELEKELEQLERELATAQQQGDMAIALVASHAIDEIGPAFPF